jgi:hypothetical protein
LVLLLLLLLQVAFQAILLCLASLCKRGKLAGQPSGKAS